MTPKTRTRRGRAAGAALLSRNGSRGPYSISHHGGNRRLLSALAAGAGAVFVLVIGGELSGLAHLLVPVTTGGFLYIYIASSDLIPELKHDASLTTSCWQLVCIVLGVAVMALLVLLEG